MVTKLTTPLGLGGAKSRCPRKLSKHVSQLLALEARLEEENSNLREKEKVLMQSLSCYSYQLHHLALLQMQLHPKQTQPGATNHADLLSDAESGPTPGPWSSALAADVEAWQLLQQLHPSNSSSNNLPGVCSVSGGSSSSSELLRTERQATTITPDNITAVQQSSVEQLAERLKSATRRIALLQMTAQQPPRGAVAAAGLLQDSLEAAYEDYGLLCQSIHMGGGTKSLELSCLNLDSMQPEAPPPGFWASVAEQITLDPEQESTLVIAYEVYKQQWQRLIEKSHQIMQQLQQLQGFSTAPPGSGVSAGPASPMTSSTSHIMALSQQFDGLLELATFSNKAEQLLQQLLAVTSQLREVSRHTTFHFVNTVRHEQMATAITASYPFWVQPVPICDHIWKQHQLKQGSTQVQDRRQAGKGSSAGSGGRGSKSNQCSSQHSQPGPGQAGLSGAVGSMQLKGGQQQAQVTGKGHTAGGQGVGGAAAAAGGQGEGHQQAGEYVE